VISIPQAIRKTRAQVAPNLADYQAECDGFDSLDHVRFIEALTTTSGVPIAEEDYTYFTTLADGAEFLANRSTR
jgi:acyl carrier protein